MTINKVMLVGNLTRDPEIRRTANDTAVLSFGMAVNERIRNGDSGEWTDRPNYFDCTMFGKRAEKLCEMLAKGQKVAIEGKLRWNQWEKDGQKRSKVEVVVDELEFMSRGGGSGSYGSNGRVQQSTADVIEVAYYDEEIPF